jgi:ABC-type polysaccharide/polyol phosphate transport system ATPase subunit
MNKNLAIKLTEVTKKYVIHHEKPTLAEKLINSKHESFLALKNINIEIKKGEKVGIIGANGSGKTTILKIIAGITTPTEGNVVTKGKVVSLIDLEAGFHPDLTGEQNIYLNGMLLGMRKKEISKRLKNIIKFADIGRFIDAPLYTYSSGMALRLGFSIAVYSDPDILLLDETLAVGDAEFRKRSSSKIQELQRSGKTILLVSHTLELIRTHCIKAVWLEKGRIKMVGKPSQVIRMYLKSKW